MNETTVAFRTIGVIREVREETALRLGRRDYKGGAAS
jgi:hypothetical protein